MKKKKDTLMVHSTPYWYRIRRNCIVRDFNSGILIKDIADQWNLSLERVEFILKQGGVQKPFSTEKQRLSLAQLAEEKDFSTQQKDT